MHNLQSPRPSLFSMLARVYFATALFACSANRATLFSVAFQHQHPPIGSSRKAAFSFLPAKSLPLPLPLPLRASKNDASDHENASTETNDSLRRAIENLVSIIDEPTNTNTNSPSATTTTTNLNQSSIVHIIGTGLTPTLLNLPLSTLLTLSQADVVLYDSLGLSYQDICQVVPKHCELICVGKRGDKKSWKQKDIDELILKMATDTEPISVSQTPDSDDSDDDAENNEQTTSPTTTTKTKSIVRLKGGDPFLFGRTKTEIETLRSQKIPYTYTPGISSCIAGPHLGGIPLTDPSLDCQSFGVWSGTDAFGKSWGLMDMDSNDNGNDDDTDTKKGKKWKGLDVDVLVFLMIGRLDKLEALCKSIATYNGADHHHHDDEDAQKQKWSKDTPCAIIQNAGGRRKEEESRDDSTSTSTLPVQRVWRSTLENIVTVIKEEDMTRTSVSPAVFVVGATAALDLLSQDYQ